MENQKYIKQQNNDLELYCGVLSIPLVFCTVANYTFTSLFGGYILFGLYVFSFVSLLIFSRRQKKVEFDIKSLLAFLCFAFVYAFSIFLTNNINNNMLNIVFFSVAVFYGLAIVYNATNPKILRYISVVSLISVAISVVLSVIVLIEEPGASRILASSAFEVYGASKFRSQGLAGFGLTYALIFFIPILLYWIKISKKKGKVLITLFAVLVVINIILSGYTTALILGVLAICAYFFINAKPYPKLFFILFLVMFILFQSYFLPDLLYSISELMGSKQMADHIVEIADILAGKSVVDDLGRTQLMKQSWNSFLLNPLFGGYVNSIDTELGGHSTFFDVLGGTGLLGFVPYCLFTYLFYKQVKTQIKNIKIKKVWAVETVVFFALQIFNPIIANYEIIYAYMCVAPAMLFYTDLIGESQ